MANTNWSTTDRLNVTVGGTNNLVVSASTGVGAVRTADRNLTGKFYFEYTCTTWTVNVAVGIANANAALNTVFSTPLSAAYVQGSGGNIWVNNVSSGTLGARANGDVICVALDLDNRLVWFKAGAAGNWNGSTTANPATQTGGLSIGAFGGGAVPLLGLVCFNNAIPTLSVTGNFGDTTFVGAVPTGFTSGFTSGATFVTQQIVTQTSIEHWAGPGLVQMRLTQAAIEEWATVLTTATVGWASLNLRETLSSGVGIPYLTGQVREALNATLPAIFSQQMFVRENLVSLSFLTLVRNAKVVREMLVAPTFSQVTASIRETLLNEATPIRTAGWFSKGVRETLLWPFSLARFAKEVRESLILTGPVELHVAKLAKEILTIQPFATLRIAGVVSEALITPTFMYVSSLLQEKLRDARRLLGVTSLLRESIIVDSEPLPPAKHRKAWVWINIGKSHHG